MPAQLSVVKGKVVAEGALTDAQVPDLVRRFRGRSRLELRGARLETFELLEQLSGLAELELVRTRVADASALARLPALRLLWLNGPTFGAGLGFLGDLAQVTELHLLNLRGPLDLPELAGMTALRTFRVWGCAGLRDLSVLEGVPHLEEVDLVDTGLEPDDLVALLAAPSVRYVSAQFATKGRNARFAELLTAHGKVRYRDGA